MYSIKEKLQIVFQIFMQIVTFVTLGASIYITVFIGADGVISMKVLWQILGVSALCALWSFLLFSKEELSKKEMLVRKIIHFLMIDVTVLVCGFWFGWFFLSDWRTIVGMELTIIAVYIAVAATDYHMYHRESEEMNRRLKERRLERGEKIDE